MEDLRDFLDSARIIDLDLNGNQFTWSNRRIAQNFIQCRLDRTFVSVDWYDHFQETTLISLPRVASDHTPLLLEAQARLRKNAPFHFEYMWMEHPNFFNNLTQW